MYPASVLCRSFVRGIKLLSITLPVWLACATTTARANITPLSSSIRASALADVDPDQPNVPDLHQDSTPDGHLRPMSVNSFDFETQPIDLSESVATSASVSYIGDNTIIVRMAGARSGTDSSPGGAGGEYASVAAYRLRFQNLTANSSLTVSYLLNSYDRPYEQVTTPIGFGVRDAFQVFHGDSVRVPFDSHSGSGLQGSQTLDLASTGFLGMYTLELDLSMVGRTSDLAPPENWDIIMTITTPPMTITPVPEPATAATLVLGLALVGWVALRRRHH